jgi:hypothetical protein
MYFPIYLPQFGAKFQNCHLHKSHFFTSVFSPMVSNLCDLYNLIYAVDFEEYNSGSVSVCQESACETVDSQFCIYFKTAHFWPITKRVEIITTRWVVTQMSAVRRFCAAEALNRALYMLRRNAAEWQLSIHKVPLLEEVNFYRQEVHSNTYLAC